MGLVVVLGRLYIEMGRLLGREGVCLRRNEYGDRQYSTWQLI